MSRFRIYAIAFAVFFLPTLPLSAQEAPPQPFDPEKYVGDYQKLDQPHSQAIDWVYLNLNIPEGYRLLPNFNQRLRIFTPDEAFSWTFRITNEKSMVPLFTLLNADRLMAEVKLFYCVSGNNALCVTSRVMYEIPLVDTGTAEDLILVYILPGLSR